MKCYKCNKDCEYKCQMTYLKDKMINEKMRIGEEYLEWYDDGSIDWTQCGVCKRFYQSGIGTPENAEELKVSHFVYVGNSQYGACEKCAELIKRFIKTKEYGILTTFE